MRMILKEFLALEVALLQNLVNLQRSVPPFANRKMDVARLQEKCQVLLISSESFKVYSLQSPGTVSPAKAGVHDLPKAWIPSPAEVTQHEVDQGQSSEPTIGTLVTAS